MDGDGLLHLKITFRDGRWHCAEVITTGIVGYGTYTFRLTSRVDRLDTNVVLGLFTWDTAAPEYNNREIDIEFSRWGDESNENAQYVVQPWTTAANMHRFGVELEGDYSTHRFDWSMDSIQFQSYQGHDSPPDPGSEIESWLYTGADIPPEGKANARINLWLFGGSPPSDLQEAEVIIESFEFVPRAD